MAQATAALSEAASDELTRALTEENAPGGEAQAYADSVRVLRRDWLTRQREAHSRAANAASQQGDAARAMQELSAVRTITQQLQSLE